MLQERVFPGASRTAPDDFAEVVRGLQHFICLLV